MAKRVHIHLYPTRDAVKHDPKNGQFTSGGGGSGGGKGEIHHSKLKRGDALYDKNGQKIDYVESVGPAMHAAERTIHTRAGYAHKTQGGHLPNGMHAKPSEAK